MTVICGPVITGLYREVDCNVLVLGQCYFGGREAGCLKEVDALYSDHYRQVLQYLLAFSAFTYTIVNLCRGVHWLEPCL